MEMELRVFNRGGSGRSLCPADRTGVENRRIFSLLDLLNYLGSFSGGNGIVFLNEKVAGTCYENKNNVSCFFVGLVAIIIDCHSDSSVAAGMKFHTIPDLQSTNPHHKHIPRDASGLASYQAFILNRSHL